MYSHTRKRKEKTHTHIHVYVHTYIHTCQQVETTLLKDTYTDIHIYMHITGRGDAIGRSHDSVSERH